MLKRLLLAMTLTALAASAFAREEVAPGRAVATPPPAMVKPAGEKVPAQVPNDTKAVDALVKKLEAIKTLSARFQQEMVADNGRSQTLSGEIQLKRPNLFFWHTLLPYEQEIITRDNKVWNIDHDLMQVVIQKQDIESENTPVKLLSGNAREFLKNYYVVEEDYRGDKIYSLRPNGKGALFEQLDVHFNKSGVLTGFSMVDSLGGKRRIDLKQVDINNRINDSQFQASYPKNYDVIDESQPPKPASQLAAPAA